MAKKKAPKLNPKSPASDDLHVPANDTDISPLQSTLSEYSGLRKIADDTKRVVDEYFIEVTDDCDCGVQDNLIYSVEAPSIGRRFFRFRDPQCNSPNSGKQKFLLFNLSMWEHLEMAFSMMQVGNQIQALGHLCLLCH
jgi:hypothetical protein